MQGFFVYIEILYKRDDTTLILEDVLFIGAFVVYGYLKAAIKKGQLSQPGRESIEVVFGFLKDCAIRFEGDRGSGMLRGSPYLNVRSHSALFIPLPVNPPVPSNLHLQPFGEGIDNGDAHAVQAARYAIGFVIELAPSVQHSHDDLQGRPVELRMVIYRDAAAIIFDGDASVHVDDHIDLFAIASQGLVHAVINYLVDQVMQPQGVCAADIHRGPAPDCLKAFKNLDLACVIARCFAQN